MKQQNPNNKLQIKEVPVVVKIISVIYYISAALLLVAFILLIGGLDFKFLASIFILVFLLGLAILCFFIGKGLWKGDSGAKIVAIIISILTIVITIALIIILSILSKHFANPMNDISSLGNIQNILNIFDIRKFIPKSIIFIVINAFIAGYLLFNKRVKEAFKKD